MVEDVTRAHQTLTVGELKLAFTYAVRGKLDFDANTYQHFSLKYLHDLLNAFKKFSVEERKYLRPEDYNDAPAPYDIHIFTQGVSIDHHRELIQGGYKGFLNGTLVNKDWIPFEWCQVLTDDGFIQYDSEAYQTFNKKWTECTEADKKRLANGQELVWALFERAKQIGRYEIYRQVQVSA
jgi:hypothetical protein